MEVIFTLQESEYLTSCSEFPDQETLFHLGLSPLLAQSTNKSQFQKSRHQTLHHMDKRKYFLSRCLLREQMPKTRTIEGDNLILHMLLTENKQ